MDVHGLHVKYALEGDAYWNFSGKSSVVWRNSIRVWARFTQLSPEIVTLDSCVTQSESSRKHGRQSREISTQFAYILISSASPSMVCNEKDQR